MHDNNCNYLVIVWILDTYKLAKPHYQSDLQLNAKLRKILSLHMSCLVCTDSILLVCRLQHLSGKSCSPSLFRSSVTHLCAGLHIILLKIHTIPVDCI